MIVIWICLMLLGFAGSGLYSGLETGAYTLNRVRLHLLDQQGLPAARRLRKLIERPTVLLTTLLIGTNVANYLGTASLSVIFRNAGLGDWTTILLNTALVTPILFILCETVPKDFFAAHADRWMYRLSGVLNVSRRLFTWTGIVPVVALFTTSIMKALGSGGQVGPLHPRRRVEALVKEGVGYGLLSDEQSTIVERVLTLTSRRVRDEIVPWAEVMTVNVDEPSTALWELANRTSHSRFPVVAETNPDSGGISVASTPPADAAGGQKENVTEVVGVLDVTEALLHGRESCPPIRELMAEAVTLDADMPLRRALGELQNRHIALAVVVDADGQPLGVVTAKDLVEPITGELSSW